MPFLKQGEYTQNLVVAPIEPDYNYDPLFFREVVPAAFRLENSIGSATAKGAFDVIPGAPYDPNFDPISLVPEQYALDSRAYVHANNQAEVDQITQRLDRELANRETVEVSGGLGTLAVFAADVFDPIRFVIVLVIVLFSKKKWIVIVAAALAAVTVETILYSTQISRTWGEGLPIGFLASLVVATIVFTIRWWREIRSNHPSINASEIPQEVRNKLLVDVEAHLKGMGYDLTPYGAGVAVLELESGYNAVETASHISLTTLALDVREAGTDIEKLMRFGPHAMALLESLKSYRDKGRMKPAQWQNDANAIVRVSTVDECQEEWLEKVLSDPIAGKERLATMRFVPPFPV